MKHKGTTAVAYAQSTHAQGTNKNISFKNIRVGRGCLLSSTHSTSEDKVRVFYAIKIPLQYNITEIRFPKTSNTKSIFIQKILTEPLIGHGKIKIAPCIKSCAQYDLVMTRK